MSETQQEEQKPTKKIFEELKKETSSELAMKEKESAAKQKTLEDAEKIMNLINNINDPGAQEIGKELLKAIREGDILKMNELIKKFNEYLKKKYEEHLKKGDFEKARQYEQIIQISNQLEKNIALLTKYYFADSLQKNLVINETTWEKVYPTFKRFLDSVNATQILESEKIKQIEYVRDICIHAALNISSGNGLSEDQINTIKTNHMQGLVVSYLDVYHNSVNNIYILSCS